MILLSMKVYYMEVLVTGASGNLGRRVVDKLRHDHSVHAVDKTTVEQGLEVTTHQLDIVEDIDALGRLIDDIRPSAIIHLAAIVGGICEQNPEEARRLNTDVTVQLAHLARAYKVGHFVFASSAAVYNQTELSPTTENENIDPRGIYGMSKYKAEQGIGAIALKSSYTQFTTLRIFNAYGHGFQKSLVERLRTSHRQNAVGLVAWNNFYRDYIHADDIASGIESAAQYRPDVPEHTVINIASGQTRSNAALVREMIDLGVEPSYVRTNDDDAPDYSWADIGRAAELLDFHPNTSIDLRS